MNYDKFKEALASFHEAEKYSNNPILYKNMARAYYNIGKYEKALKLCNQVLLQQPKDKYTLFLKGNVQSQLGQP